MFGMACICHSSLHMPGILVTPTYDIPILPEACQITPQQPTGKPGDGITTWWCHHTRTVCIHHTSVPGRWIIYRDIFPCWYFVIFFFVYYGRQLRQLTIVESYRLLGPIPRNSKSNVLVDLHPLAQIVPCMNVLLFWMDTICRQ